jgi:hypothetical protein
MEWDASLAKRRLSAVGEKPDSTDASQPRSFESLALHWNRAASQQPAHRSLIFSRVERKILGIVTFPAVDFVMDMKDNLTNAS